MSVIIDYFTQNLFPLILSIGAVLLLFGGTVLIHELGHFLTAKWFGLRIDAFSIGMGPALWKKEINGVVYKISLLPIGGYVALPQMDITGSAFENEDAKDGKLGEIAPWKRIVIAVAGPFMNVVAAFVLAIIVWQVGKPPDPGPGPAVVGYVIENSPAYEAGLREGDTLLKINDDKIHFWDDFRIAGMLNQKLDMLVLRDQELINFYQVPTVVNAYGFRQVPGIGPVEPSLIFLGVHKVFPDTPAEKAGLQAGDKLLSIDGEDVVDSQDFVTKVSESKGEPLAITVQSRNEEDSKVLSLAANWDEELQRWMIGIEFSGEYENVHPTPLSQIRYFSGSIFRTLKAFTRPKEMGLAAKGVGGPVMILSGMHSQVKFHPMQALWFTALININLAIINLLPLIILDGGHIMVALFEIVTGRKPYRRLITSLANLMVVLLLTMMVVLSFKDVLLIRKINKEVAVPEETGTPVPGTVPPDQTE
ncbi:RIP metalloprotease RseP [Kiritimatiellaeota bacterium B1221]|nr:RIP metalloprotease RseP [Kiritimatiellaeota bacterium B1221]